MAEILRGLTIYDAGYYNSDKNDAKRYPKEATHTSDGNKNKGYGH